MILGIDAFNIRAGGGVTHLVELLRAADPVSHGFSRVIVWAGTETLMKIEPRDWLVKVNPPQLNRGLLSRVYWHRFMLRRLAIDAGCSILLVPGGSDASGFSPVVSMSQNMLPFERRELIRFGWSLTTLRLIALRWTQGRTFKKAQGVIFLTKYALNGVASAIGKMSGAHCIVPHGINPRFFNAPRQQKDWSDFNFENPCRLLYVSIVDVYKHQWHLAEAVARLRASGLPVVLDLVGPPAAGIGRLEQILRRVDPERAFIRYMGAVPYDKLESIYVAADIGVFASSCEAMPNILLEGMAAGLPQVCSNRGPMPEILGNGGIYFDPEDVDSIVVALNRAIQSKELRQALAESAYGCARAYSWDRCAKDTFRFISAVAAQRDAV